MQSEDPYRLSSDEILDDSPEAAASATIHHGLVLVSTPIGNLRDVTFRALEQLRHADVILCEDTRTSARLLQANGIATRCESLHDFNEEERLPSLIARLRRGERMALIADAGTPLVSDPGYRLVRACIAAGIQVTAAPGANAAVMALTLSGLPPHPFLFGGFLPPKQGARKMALSGLRAAEQAGLAATLIWYEAPHRLAETLADMADVLGDRPAAVARELTKRFEEVRRGSLAELAAFYAGHEARGEIVILAGPAPEESAVDVDQMLRTAMAGMSLKDAAAAVAEASGLPKKQIYARALAMKQTEG